MTFARIAPRPIRIDGAVAYVPLTQGYEAIIDSEDADRVGKWSWCAVAYCGSVYAMRRAPGGGRRSQRHVRLHHEIMGRKVRTDHRNLNTLDCRKENLREATHAQNNMNRGAQRNNALGIKGVRQMADGRFIARITANRQTQYLGTFQTAESAQAAYAAAATELHGEFARVL